MCAGSEFALFAIPVSVVQYMPNFFFGSLLMIFGVEIIADWLLFSYRKVTSCSAVYSTDALMRHLSSCKIMEG